MLFRSHQKRIVFDLQQPKDPKQFFSDVLLVGNLEKACGELELRKLKMIFGLTKKIDSSFQNVSAKFEDYFSVQDELFFKETENKSYQTRENMKDSYFSLEEFKRIFLSAGKCVIDLFDLGEVQFMQNKFADKDLFVIVSLSGETAEGIQILKAIESTKIKTLSITRFENNTIARICKDNLYVSTKMLHGLQNLSYEMTAAFYVLLDILFVNYLEYTRENKR